MLLLTASEMRDLDSAAAAEFSVATLLLMENAGRGCAEIAGSLLPRGRPGKVAIVAGPGNNGGDGFVMARHLANRGVEVRTYHLASPERYRGDALVNFEALRRSGGDLVNASGEGSLLDRQAEIARADVVVDALFGTGLEREILGYSRQVVELLNEMPGVRLAVDIPSGVDSDRGRVLGAAIRAHHTVTLAYPKRGLYLYPGAEHAGRIHLVDIGIPAAAAQRRSLRCRLATAEDAWRLCGPRQRRAHKGRFGHLLVLAGSREMPGAALLAVRGALRAGVGLCTLAAGAEVLPLIAGRVPEAMLSEASVRDVDALGALAAGKTAVVVGPGLGQVPEVVAGVRRIVAEWSLPVVVDADGLNALAGDLAALGRAPAGVPRILTPHPGEMGRLCGKPVIEIESDRMGVAAEFAARHRVVVVLKGARTTVASPDGRQWLIPAGNPGMATGGMGDVLAGIIGALLCQGLSAEDAAWLGAFVHAVAGDRACHARGERGMIPSDVALAVAHVIRAIERGQDPLRGVS